jgi:glycosyltransferase involved in cell wall biosynthesis
MFYFDDSVVQFFESGNVSAMVDAMLQIIKNTSLRESLVANGYEYCARNNWDVRRQEYFDLVDLLSSRQNGKPVPGALLY